LGWFFKLNNMKTAMQIAVESYKNDGVSFTDWFLDNYKMLLKKEKEQIEDAWDAGMSEGIGTTMADLDWDGEFINYYNETYTK